MVLIGITRLRVGAWRYLRACFSQALRSTFQARAVSGNIAVSGLREAHRTFWTCTAWVDEKAMRTYMSEGVHRSAMRSLAVSCDEDPSHTGRKSSSDFPRREPRTAGCNERVAR
jgi:hypothetical protein